MTIRNNKRVTIDNQPSLLPLAQRMVPQAAKMLNNHLLHQSTLTASFEQGRFIVQENDRLYAVNPQDYSCECPFAVENLLPCRHSLHMYQFLDLQLENFPVKHRWLREHNRLLEVPSMEFNLPRQNYVHNSGTSALIDAALFMSRHLDPSVIPSIAREMKAYALRNGPIPQLPYFNWSGVAPASISTVTVPIDNSVIEAAAGANLLEEQQQETMEVPSFTPHETAPPVALLSSKPRVDDVQELHLFQQKRKIQRQRNNQPGPSHRPLDETGSTVPAVFDENRFAVCGECGNLESPEEEQSMDNRVECENCGQWYHWYCVYVPGFQEEVICTRCEAPLVLQRPQ